MAKKRSFPEFIIRLDNFSSGINTFINPFLLNNQVPDATNVIFDEPVGRVRKIPGWSEFNSFDLGNRTPIKAIDYIKSTGESFIVVCVRNNDTGKYEVFYSKEGTSNWEQIVQANSIEPFDFAVLDDILWICNNVSTPIVFNGLEKKLLNGQGVDWDNNPIANFTLPLGLTPGKFIEVHQNRIVMANTAENGSEIIFSRFVDDDGNLLKATASKAWININQILVSPEDGEEITAIYPYLGMLCVFKEYSLYIISGDLTNPSIIKIPTSKGCVDANSIQEINNMLVYLSNDGIYGFNGREVILLSKDIDAYLKDLTTSISRSKIQSIRISTTQEFQSAQVSINNFKTVNSAENSLASPQNFVLNNSNDFYVHCRSQNNIIFENGIQLKHKESKYNYNVSWSSRKTDGLPQDIFDGNFNTRFKVYSFFQQSLAAAAEESASMEINVNFTTKVLLKSFIIKYRLISRTTQAGGEVVQLDNFLEYIVNDTKYTIDSRYYVTQFATKHVLSEDTEECTKQINVNLETDNIKFKAYAHASVHKKKWLEWSYLDATAEIQIYEITFDYEAAREENGYYITNWIDTEKLSNFGFSTFVLDFYVPYGTNVYAYYTQSDYIAPIDDNTVWTPINSGQVPNITKRYYAYKIVLTTTAPLNTPIVRMLKQNFNSYSEWIGRKTLTVSPNWLNFFCSYNTNGGAVHFYLSKDGINYTEVYNESNIANILAGSNTVYIKVTAERSGDNGTPQIFAIYITYQLGVAGQILNISSAEFENRYFLKLPDKIIVLNKTGSWSKLDIPNLNCFVEFLGRLLVFINKKLYKFLDDEVFTVPCDITTKSIVLGTPLEVFLIRKIWLFFDKNAKTNSNVILEIYDGKSNSPVESFSVFFDRTKNITNPIEINCGIKCYQFYAKLKNTAFNEDFSLLGMEFYVRPLRVLSKEE